MDNKEKRITAGVILIGGVAIAVGFYFSSSEFLAGGLRKVPNNKIVGKVPIILSLPAESKKIPHFSAQPAFYDEKILQETLQKNESVAVRNDIRAVISPHHSLAADLIASIVKEASGRSVRTVAIIAPNHGHIGVESLATVQASWQTPFGNIDTDGPVTDNFMADFGLLPVPEAFENEHGIGSLVPYVRYYFPDAKILPILINNSAREKTAEDLSDWLVENIPADGLVIFSMDFSHYLTKAEADKSDALTREFISSRDVGKIIQLNDDYVDTPIGLATSVLFAEKAGLQTEFVGNGNSFDLISQKPKATTSYFTIRFLK